MPWQPVSIGVAQPCWEGWNASFVLYTQQEHVMGACCAPDGTCTLTAESDCQPPDVWQGPGTTCDPNPCQGVPVDETTWGRIKKSYH